MSLLIQCGPVHHLLLYMLWFEKYYWSEWGCLDCLYPLPRVAQGKLRHLPGALQQVICAKTILTLCDSRGTKIPQWNSRANRARGVVLKLSKHFSSWHSTHTCKTYSDQCRQSQKTTAEDWGEGERSSSGPGGPRGWFGGSSKTSDRASPWPAAQDSMYPGEEGFMMENRIPNLRLSHSILKSSKTLQASGYQHICTVPP